MTTSGYSHYQMPQPEDYDDVEIYREQLEIWRQNEEELMVDYD